MFVDHHFFLSVGNSAYSGRLRPPRLSFDVDYEGPMLNSTLSLLPMSASRRSSALFQRLSRTSSMNDFAASPAFEILFFRGDDDKFYKCMCTLCNKDRFKNALGFLNHMRIVHNILLYNHENARRTCRVEVNEKDIPADHPCWTEIPTRMTEAPQDVLL